MNNVLVPKGWGSVRLGDIVEVQIGGTPSRKIKEYWDSNKTGNNKWVSIRDLKGRAIEDTSEYITEKGIKHSNVKKIPKGTLLMSFKLTLGRVAITGDDLYTNEAIAAFIIKGDVNRDYLYHIMPQVANTGDIDIAVKGKTLNKRKLQDIQVILPPLPEQKKIAEILESVDQAIEETDNIIKESEKIKKGLLQTVFFHGLPTGEIEGYKDTKIGTIPKDWDVEKLGGLFTLIKSGLSRLLKNNNVGIPCLRSTNMIDGRLDITDLKYWHRKDPQGANVDDYILKEGDILLNFINSIAQIGKTCLYKDIGREAMYTTNILRMKVDPNKILTRYFYYYSYSPFYQKEIVAITKPAVNQASFTTADFKRIMMPVPPIEKQKEIVSFLDGINERINHEGKKKKQLQKIKKGLMQKLLTGQIRVEVD